MSVAFSPDGKTIAAGYARGGGIGGVVLWDVAARHRLADEPLAVDEGVRPERGLQPRRQDPRRRIRPAATAAWCCGTWPTRRRLADRAAPREGGRGQERGLQPRRQDHRRRIRPRRRRGGVVLWDVAARAAWPTGPSP